MHNVYIIDLEDGRSGKKPVLGDGGKAEVERGSVQSQKSSQGTEECGGGSEHREEGPTFGKTRRSPKAALGKQRINAGGQTVTEMKVGNSRLRRQGGGVSNQRPLPEAGFYTPGWADRI